MGVDFTLLGPIDETDRQKFLRFVQLELAKCRRKKEQLVNQLLRVNQEIVELEETLETLNREENCP